MKRGFRIQANGEAEVQAEQQALYQHVPRKILRELCGGFGRDVAQYFRTHASTVQEQEIKMICMTDPNEIDRILDEIEAIL